MSLHCLYADPASTTGERLRALATPGDAILLLGTAVALARRGHPGLGPWVRPGIALHALASDIASYGVAPVDERVQVIDYAGWVALASDQPRQLLWR